jgi:hypothetical protein
MLLSVLTEVAPKSDILKRNKAAYELKPTVAYLLKTTASHGSNPVYQFFGGMLYFIDNGRYRISFPSDPRIKSEILHDCLPSSSYQSREVALGGTGI